MFQGSPADFWSSDPKVAFLQKMAKLARNQYLENRESYEQNSPLKLTGMVSFLFVFLIMYTFYLNRNG